MRLVLLVLVMLGCGSSAPPQAASPPPANPAPVAPAATVLAGDARCHQAVDHMDQLVAAKAPDREAATARLQAIQQARAAGILADNQVVDCTKSWTNSVVDCVLAANESATAKACIPAT